MSDEKDPQDIDDVPVNEVPFDNLALEHMSEDDWLLLKNELQEYLHRIAQSENSAYEGASVVGWINQYGARFDEFYEYMRHSEPTSLLRWQKRALDEDGHEDAEFIREWVAFRDGDA